MGSVRIRIAHALDHGEISFAVEGVQPRQLGMETGIVGDREDILFG